MSAQALVQATGLHTYYGNSHVLHGVDLQIQPGETLALMGRNGMGKSTTIRSLLGLTPARRGEVLIRGERCSGRATHQIIRRGIGYVPEGRGMFPNLSGNLSGGEQQMVAIGRALLTNPELMILDEATEGLAPLIRKEIWDVIRLIKASGIATLVVDKNVNVLLDLTDRSMIMVKGRVVFDGPSVELKCQPQILQEHIGL
jgi:branched-chain amino acid transport system ATP-binding protein